MITTERAPAMASGAGRPSIDQAAWQPWIDRMAAELGVSAEGLDVGAIHELTGRVAEVADRPCAPLAAQVWAMGRATHPQVSPVALADTLVRCAERAARERP